MPAQNLDTCSLKNEMLELYRVLLALDIIVPNQICSISQAMFLTGHLSPAIDNRQKNQTKRNCSGMYPSGGE